MVTDKSTAALLAAFPTLKSYIQFASKNRNAKTLRSLCIFAYKSGIIDAAEEDLLKDFIRNNCLGEDGCIPPVDMDFEIFFERKEALFQLNLSTRALTERINQFLAQHRIELPKVSNSMLTRLKKEAADTHHKKNVLRSLALWLGYTRGRLGLRWNFEILRALCREGKPTQDHKEGVRIGFSLFSRGEIIDQETIGWLKSSIKNHIESAISHFSHGRWGKIRTHDITTLYVDFPKEEPIDSPVAYRHCLRSALSLSHQIALRWALSPHHTQNRFLSIGIAIGEYAQIDKYLYPILTVKLPADPIIRLTDYTRQYILINSQHTLICNKPVETALYNGESLIIWWIEGFWTALYFDFVPGLLADKNLVGSFASIQQTAKKLWSPRTKDFSAIRSNETTAISTYFKSPQNAMLGVEIAKTLYYRLRLWEALEIIRIVLSLNPTDISARTLRMVMLSNLALYAPSHAIAQDLFTKAHNEALFIQDNCSVHAEDFYYAHAWVYLTQAMLDLRYLRNGKGYIEGKISAEEIKPQIFKSLAEAEQRFGIGEAVSSTGISFQFLQISARVVCAVLKSNPEIFTSPGIPIDADPEIVRKTTKEFQWLIGYFQEDFPPEPYGNLKAKISQSEYLIRKDAISLAAFKTTFYFSSAAALWDFLPQRTVEHARKTLMLLDTALKIATDLEKRNICIYSFTRCCAEMIPAKQFIQHITHSINMIKIHSGNNLDQREDRELIESENATKMHLLSTLNF